MTAPRPGMTLIELVAALALLAIIVTAALPVLQRAAVSMQPPELTIAVEDLGMLADRVMRDPATFNIESLEEIDHVVVEWPTDLENEANSARVVLDIVRIEDTDHAWLHFSVGKIATLRWIELEDEP